MSPATKLFLVYLTGVATLVGCGTPEDCIGIGTPVAVIELESDTTGEKVCEATMTVSHDGVLTEPPEMLDCAFLLHGTEGHYEIVVEAPGFRMDTVQFDASSSRCGVNQRSLTVRLDPVP